MASTTTELIIGASILFLLWSSHKDIKKRIDLELRLYDLQREQKRLKDLLHEIAIFIDKTRR